MSTGAASCAACPLSFPPICDPGDAPEVIAGIFAGSIDQQVFLFIHQILAVELAHLEIRRQLNRIRGAGLLAIPTENAREKLIRKNSGYRRPCSSSVAWRAIQLTGQATAQR